MNELATASRQLPGTLPELSKFVLVGREKLNAVRAEIRAIDKVGLAKEVHEQKLKEAQAIAEAVLDAEVKIGELTAAMPKATSGNQYTGKMVCNSSETNQKPKEQQLSDIGLTRQQASRYEMLARHPEVVQQAKESARRMNDIVNRTNVLKAIANSQPKRPDTFERAKEAHAAFEEQKKEAVVDFKAAKLDKLNQEIIAIGLHKEILSALGKVNSLLIMHNASAITEMSQNLDNDERDRLIKDCQWTHRNLSIIMNALIVD